MRDAIVKSIPPWDVTAYALRICFRYVTEGGDDGMKQYQKGFTAAQKVQIIKAVCGVLAAMITTFGPLLVAGWL